MSLAAGGTCGCHDDLFWFFAHQHAVVAKSASSREYHPMPPQPRKGEPREEPRRDARRRAGTGTEHEKQWVTTARASDECGSTEGTIHNINTFHLRYNWYYSLTRAFLVAFCATHVAWLHPH